MDIIFSLLLFIGGLVVTGLVASFSVMLYASQMAILSDARAPIAKSVALMAGIACGLALLLCVLLLVQPETLQLPAVWVNIAGRRTNTTDMILGVGVILAGVGNLLWGRNKRRHRTVKPDGSVVTGKNGRTAVLFSFGFVRAITRVTGIAALLFGVRRIFHATDAMMARLLLLLLLLAASLIPYVAMLLIRLMHPSYFVKIQHGTARMKNMWTYKTVSIVLMIIGTALIVLAAAPF